MAKKTDDAAVSEEAAVVTDAPVAEATEEVVVKETKPKAAKATVKPHQGEQTVGKVAKAKKAEKSVKTAVKSETLKPSVKTGSKKSDNMVVKYQTHEGDTGSLEVQVVLLTRDVVKLAKHLDEHKHDFDSRRGLLKMVARRRRLLTSLRSSDPAKYAELIADLGLRK